MCGTAAASSQQAQELFQMRQSLKNTLKSSLLDGRFREAVAIIKKEKAEKEEENMRLGMQETFQGAMADGRLLEVVTAMRNEKKAKEIAEMQQSVKSTLQTSLANGRLSEVISALLEKKKAKEVEKMKQTLKMTFQSSLCDGRLAEVVATVKKERQAKELENMRQDLRSSLQSSLCDGRLAEIVATVKKEKQAKELENMRLAVRSSLQSSVHDGRLATAVATLKKEREAKELENMRQDLRCSLQSSVLDGRLAGVMRSLKEKRQQAEKQQLEQDALLEVEAMRANVQSCFRVALNSGRLTEVFAKVRADNVSKTIVTAAAAPMQQTPVPQPVDACPTDAPAVATAAKPCRPSTDRTSSARPIRRSVSTAVSGELQEQSAIQQSSVADVVKLPSPKVSMLPPRPPALGSSVTESPKAAGSMSKCTLTPRASLTLRPGETLSRPASPVGRLPPVQPPMRKLAAAAPAAPSAMALDLGTCPSATSLDLCSVKPPLPSAMSLDLCGAKPPVPPSAMSLDLGAEWKTCHSRSLSNVRLEKAAGKQAPSFLPPIAALKGQVTKSSVHKRSSSMDSFVWGVGPAHLENIHVNTAVF